MRSAASLHRRESDEPAHKAAVGSAAGSSGRNAHIGDDNGEDEDEEEALEMIREREVRVDPDEDLASDLGQSGTIKASRVR